MRMLYEGAAGLLLALLVALFGIHQVEEGHVGMYWRGGALLTEVTEPGYHTQLPLLTSMEQVQVSVQTDKVLNVPCGTSGGVLIHFERIEVVNRLHKDQALDIIRRYGVHYDRIWIFDKIHHLLNQFCSRHSLQDVYISEFADLDEMLTEALQADCDRWAPGLEIIATRVTKPRLPASIMEIYEQVEIERTNLLIANERQKCVEKRAETAQLNATINAEAEREVSRLRMDQEVMERKIEQEIALINDRINAERVQTVANASHYRMEALARANALKHTEEYLNKMWIESLGRIPKQFYSTDLESVYREYSPLSNVE